MAFIKKIIGPDEALIGITSAHWIYGVIGIMWMAGLTIAAVALDYFSVGFLEYLFRGQGDFAADQIADALFWMLTVLGVVMFFFYLLMMVSPEIGLTSKRVIYKRGIIFVDVKEVDIDEIKAANVDNGLFGRFFNYGYVLFDARFMPNMSLPAISNPYLFVRVLNDARSKLKEESITGILEGVDPEEYREEREENARRSVDGKTGNTREGAVRRRRRASEAYPDRAESSRRAVRSVISEIRNNAAHAIRGAPLSPFKAPEQKKTAGTEQQGPLVFDDPVLTKQRELRQEIKDDFSDTAA